MSSTSGHGARDPRIVSERPIHRGKKFDFVELSVERPGGKVLKSEVVRHPGAVVVVPILEVEAEKRVVLIRNYRIAVEERLYECCAGTIERGRAADGRFVSEADGEEPRVCAGRELEEETGYAAGRLHPLGWFYTTPGLTDEKMHAFVATGLTHVGQRLEEDETIEVVTAGAAEIVRLVADGSIRDAKSMLAILLAREQGWLG
jgi:ADP-ribose pyrophosphatase